jgi:PAS domain S-box-containing protein
METPQFPKDEARRLKILNDFGILDSALEERFDRITRLAQQIFKVKIALVSLVDANRQWFKSKQGLAACETGRDISFCGHAILDENIFHIPDARLDDRFADNPLVLDEPNIRLYAGAPLLARGKTGIGTLCIIDDQPRTLNAVELSILRDLADCVEKEIERHQQERQHSALITLAQISALNSTDIHQVMHQALNLACSFLNFSSAFIAQPTPQELHIRFSVSDREDILQLMKIPLSKSLCKLTLEHDSIFFIQNLSEGIYAKHSFHTEFQFQSYLGIPIKRQGSNFGSLFFAHQRRNSKTQINSHEREFLQLLADWVGSTLERHDLNESLRKQQQLNHVIATAQAQFIRSQDRKKGFDDLLDGVIKLTQSKYGFIGEVLYDNQQQPYLKTYSITDISWDKNSQEFYKQNAPIGFEFSNLSTLFGHVLTTGQALISNNPIQDPLRGGLPQGHPTLHSFLGIPIHHDQHLIAMLGIANRQHGYDPSIIDFLTPITNTMAQLVNASQIQSQHNENERRLANIIKGTHIGTWEWSIKNHSIIINERWAEIIGYTLDELTPFTLTLWQSLIHPDDLLSAEEKLAKHMKGDLEYYEHEHRLKHKNGHWVWVLGRGGIIQNDDFNNPTIMSGSLADISERKRMETMKQDFISTVSHELRTPLTSINGSLGLIMGGALGIPPTAMTNILNIAHKNSQRLGVLINDLLDMEKLTSGKMYFDFQLYSLNELLQCAIDSNSPYGASRDIKIVLKTSVPECSICVDQLRLMQVFSNLLSNAIKYSPEHAEVEIHCNIVKIHTDKTRTESSEQLKISVIDHGTGIASQFHDQIFQKFMQADSSNTKKVGGTGLGLAISRELMQRMNGTIDFDPHHKNGAHFYIYLPIAPSIQLQRTL